MLNNQSFVNSKFWACVWILFQVAHVRWQLQLIESSVFVFFWFLMSIFVDIVKNFSKTWYGFLHVSSFAVNVVVVIVYVFEFWSLWFYILNFISFLTIMIILLLLSLIMMIVHVFVGHVGQWCWCCWYCCSDSDVDGVVVVIIGIVRDTWVNELPLVNSQLWTFAKKIYFSITSTFFFLAPVTNSFK